MKKSLLLTSLIALLFIAGCSTTTIPSTPTPHPEKYALQIIRIDVPADSAETSSLFKPAPAKNVEDLLNNPKAVVTEFLVTYAALGETAINDQTEALSFPTMYEPQTDSNGVVSVVYNHHKDIKIGRLVEMTLQKVENGQVTCDLWLYEKTLRGMQKYNAAPATETQDAVTASLPIFRALETKTKMTLALGAWISMGGLTSTKKEGDDSITTTTYFAIRTLPPKDVTINPPKIDSSAYKFTPDKLTSSALNPSKVSPTPAANLETTNLHPEKHTLRFVLASGTGKPFESKEAFFEQFNGPIKNLTSDDWSHFSGEPVKGSSNFYSESIFPLVLEEEGTTYTELFSAPIDLGQAFSSADKTLEGKIWQKRNATTSDTPRDSFTSFNLQFPDHDRPLELTEFHLKPNAWSPIILGRTNRVEVLLVKLYEPQGTADAQ